MLPASQARCRPAQHCPPRNHCARFVATIPPAGAALGDFSSELVGAFCPRYEPVSKYLKAPPAEKPPARRWIDRESD